MNNDADADDVKLALDGPLYEIEKLSSFSTSVETRMM